MGVKFSDFWVVGWNFTKFVLWKCINLQLKKVWRSYVSWYQRVKLCTTPFCRGVEPPTRVLKKGGVLEENSAFRGGLLGKRGKNFLTGSCYFYIKWYFCGRGGLIPQCTLWVMQNLKRNLFFVSKIARIWWILIWALKSIKKLHFDWFLLCKVYNVWPKKVQRSIFHDTRVMKNLKKNWLVVWKMTWGI